MSFNSTSKELIEQNINGLLSIHESWLRIPMDSVANITNGFAFKSAEFNNRKEGVPLIRIRDVLKGNTSTYYSGQIPEGYWVYPEDLIVGMDGDFNTTIWRSEPALLNQRVCKIEVQEDKYNKRFFYHALPGYLSAINANTSSVTVKHLSSRTLQDLSLIHISEPTRLQRNYLVCRLLLEKKKKKQKQKKNYKEEKKKKQKKTKE